MTGCVEMSWWSVLGVLIVGVSIGVAVMSLAVAAGDGVPDEEADPWGQRRG